MHFVSTILNYTNIFFQYLLFSSLLSIHYILLSSLLLLSAFLYDLLQCDTTCNYVNNASNSILMVVLDMFDNNTHVFIGILFEAFTVDLNELKNGLKLVP